MKKLLFCLLPFLSLPVMAQNGAVNGLCAQGGTAASTSGLNSSNYLEGVVPGCTVTVYQTGTVTLATIFSDPSGTPLTNPFTANPVSSSQPGAFHFFAAQGQSLDVVASGGIFPHNYPSPVTILTSIAPIPAGGVLPANGCTTAAGGNLSCNTVVAATTNGTLNAAVFSGTDILAKITAAIAQCGGGACRIKIPAGTYSGLNSTLAIPCPANIILEGDGSDATNLIWSTSFNGDGFKQACPINSTTQSNLKIRDMTLTNLNASSTFAGIDQVGGQLFYVDDVKINGFGYSVILDQTEIATLSGNNNFQGPAISGIWLVNGSQHTPGANPGFTNNINIWGNSFNAGTTQTLIQDDGGVSHSFIGNSLNGGKYAIQAGNVGTATIQDNEIESFATAGLYLPAGGPYSLNLTSKNNTFAPNAAGGTPIVIGSSLGTFVSDSDVFYSTVTAITGGANVTGIRIQSPKQLNTGAILDSPALSSTFTGTYDNGAVANALTSTGNANLPAATNLGFWAAGGFASPVSSKIYVGDGTGYHLAFSKRIGSADTDLVGVYDSTALAWDNAGNGHGTLTVGFPGSPASFWVNTPTLSSTYPSGFGIDGSYSSFKSTINLHARGVYSGSYYSNMAFCTTFQTVESCATILDQNQNMIFGGHINQSATKNFAGTCAMSSGTSCTFTINAAYTGTPICLSGVQGATLTGGVSGCALSGTTVTITAASSNSLTWGAMLIGNPN